MLAILTFPSVGLSQRIKYYCLLSVSCKNIVVGAKHRMIDDYQIVVDNNGNAGVIGEPCTVLVPKGNMGLYGVGMCIGNIAVEQKEQ
jgi:hypothetical protein